MGMPLSELEGRMSSHEFSEQLAYDRVVVALEVQQKQQNEQSTRNRKTMGK